MKNQLWVDESGFVMSAELVLQATVLVIGLLVGLVTVRDQTMQELADLAAAMSQVDQAYSFSGVTGHASSTAGTIFDDAPDFCQAPVIDPSGAAAVCISITVAPINE